MRNLILVIIALLACTAPARAGSPGILEFTQEFCPSCKAAQPLMAQLEREGVKVINHATDGQDPTAGILGIKTTPTFIVTDSHGQEFGRIVGFTKATEPQLRKLLVQAKAKSFTLPAKTSR